jgi:hypothetical protein
MTAFMIRTGTILLFCAPLLFSAVPYAAAAELLRDAVQQPASSQKKLDPALENIGLYKTSAEGSLGHDLWKGSKRSALAPLMEAMPASSPEPAIQRLIMGILLTSADTREIENDIPIVPGADLLTLRLHKLLEAGAYDKALEMYSLLEHEPDNEKLARTGILAMIHNGEKSMACLEANAFGMQSDSNDFWQSLQDYCEPGSQSLQAKTDTGIIAAVAASPDYHFEYAPQSYANLKPLEQAILGGEKRLSSKIIDSAMVKTIPASHILPLLMQDDLSGEMRLRLSVRAVGLGLKSPDDLRKLYVTMTAPAAGGEESAGAGQSLPAADWEKLPYYYHAISNAPDSEQEWRLVRQAYPLFEAFGPAAFSPLAENIRTLKPADATLEEIAMVFKILYFADSNIPAFWTNQLRKIPADVVENNNNFLPLLATAFLLASDSEEKALFKEEIIQKTQSVDAKSKQFYNTVIENIDNVQKEDNNASKAYEKDLDLTLAGNYVMPSMYAWDRLIETSKKGNVGEAILLSTILFRDQDLRSVYPKLLKDTLLSFDSMGLTYISKDILITASLNGIE